MIIRSQLCFNGKVASVDIVQKKPQKFEFMKGEKLSSLKHVGEIYRWNSSVWRKSVMAFMQSGHKNR